MVTCTYTDKQTDRETQYINTHIHTQPDTYIHTTTYIQTHIHAHTETYINIHTYTYIKSPTYGRRDRDIRRQTHTYRHTQKDRHTERHIRPGRGPKRHIYPCMQSDIHETYIHTQTKYTDRESYNQRDI